MSEENGLSIDTEFVERLSSADPTPGGGAAAAYCGALAGACASMVGNLTYNNDKFSQIRGALEESINRLNEINSDLLILVDEDAKSFEPVAKAMKLPKGELRDKKMDDALVLACSVPLEIMQKCIDVIEECEYLANNGSKLLVSDVGCATSMAKAALISASLNVYVNVRLFSDDSKAVQFKSLADNLCEDGTRASDAVYATVADKIDAYRLV